MARIAARGRLIVGTSGDKPLLAARDPRTGDLSGIDIDLSWQIARAILGPKAQVEFHTVPYSAREKVLLDGRVDMVAHSMTMTCDRWQRIGFSTEYFRDGQRLLVRRDSSVREVEDLAGQRVCVARGTTTIESLRRFPRVVAVPVDDAADCLVLSQRSEVDAITSNEIVLLGYDFIRFANGVLDRTRANGELARILSSRLAPLGRPVTVPRAVYGRR